MTTEKQTWERVRIKTKYAEIVRKVAAIRDESFIDALYRIIDYYWDAQRGIAPNKPVETITSTPGKDVGESTQIDLSDFE